MAFKKYNKIRRPSHSSVDGLFSHKSHSFIVTEKMDGNNVRFRRDGDKLRFGSRRCDLGTDVDEIGGMFDDVTDYIAEVIDPEDIRFLEERWSKQIGGEPDVTFTFFGENAVQHTITEYNWSRVPQFQLFDIYVEYDDENGDWLQWYVPDETMQDLDEKGLLVDDGEITEFSVEAIADWLGISTVPVYMKTTVGEFLDDNDLSEFEVPESFYREDDGPAEGVVFRNQVTGVKAKYISEEFAERNRSANSTDMEDTSAEFDHYPFLEKHATNRRIRKNIGKLIESPEYDYDSLEMEMMADLHILVWRDIWAEDYEEIIETDWKISMGELHNKVASKCARELRSMMQAGETPVAVVDPETGDVVTEWVEATA